MDGALKDFVQPRAHPCGARLLVCDADLPQDLVLAQKHGLQPRRQQKQVLFRRGEIFKRRPFGMRKFQQAVLRPLPRAGKVQLGAVAGDEQHATAEEAKFRIEPRALRRSERKLTALPCGSA